MSGKEIVFAGSLIVDRLKYVNAWPRPKELAEIVRQERALGGLACNCAIDMAQLAPETPVRVVGVVGEDGLGDHILEEFSRFPSINTEMVKRAGETSYTDVITTPDGERTFFQFHGASDLLKPEHFDFSDMNASILHIGYILLLGGLDSPDERGEYPTAMCRVLDDARKAGIETSIDVVSEAGERYSGIACPALAYADIVTINDIEAEGITGISLRDSGGRLLQDALEPCVRALAAQGVKKWACVHMPEVSAGMDVEKGEFVKVATLTLPGGFIRSTVGAGDAFAAGLLYGRFRGLGLAGAMNEANAVAAYSMKGYSASDAMRPLSEVLKEMEQYRG